MAEYSFPEHAKPARLAKNQVLLVASGDLRLSANQKCWPAQHEMEQALARAVGEAGYELVRAHAYRDDQQHGFIGSQKEGMEVFRSLDPKAPLIVAEAVWQYSHHVLAGLLAHRGPLLTVANWSGTWPGLVGMLNLNGSLTKAGRKYSTLWSEDFTDAFFRDHLARWLKKGSIKHKTDHVTAYKNVKHPRDQRRLGQALADELRGQAPSWASSTKAAWACSTPSCPTTCCNPRACSRSGSASRPFTTKPCKWPTTKPAKFATGWNRAA